MRLRGHSGHMMACRTRYVVECGRITLARDKGMNLQRLFEIADRAREGRKLTTEDETFVLSVVPKELTSFPELDLPASVRHPGGFTVSGASVGTFRRS